MRKIEDALLLVAVFVLGYVVSFSQRPKAVPAVDPGAVRFAPGRYLLETVNDSWGAVVTFENPWYVRPLSMPPSE